MSQYPNEDKNENSVPKVYPENAQNTNKKDDKMPVYPHQNTPMMFGGMYGYPYMAGWQYPYGYLPQQYYMQGYSPQMFPGCQQYPAANYYQQQTATHPKQETSVPVQKKEAESVPDTGYTQQTAPVVNYNIQNDTKAPATSFCQTAPAVNDSSPNDTKRSAQPIVFYPQERAVTQASGHYQNHVYGNDAIPPQTAHYVRQSPPRNFVQTEQPQTLKPSPKTIVSPLPNVQSQSMAAIVQKSSPVVHSNFQETASIPLYVPASQNKRKRSGSDWTDIVLLIVACIILIGFAVLIAGKNKKK